MKLLKGFLAILLFSQLVLTATFFSKTVERVAENLIDMILERTPRFANTSCTESCCGSLPSRSALLYVYYQNTGHFYGGNGEGAINTYSYSGSGDGRNNPAKQCVPNVGPLPATTYKLGWCTNIMHQTAQRPCSFYL